MGHDVYSEHGSGPLAAVVSAIVVVGATVWANVDEATVPAAVVPAAVVPATVVPAAVVGGAVPATVVAGGTPVVWAKARNKKQEIHTSIWFVDPPLTKLQF